MRALNLLLAAALLAAAPAPPRPVLSAYDVIGLEVAYTTILARYYKPVEPRLLLRGARDGMSAYLRSRGISGVAAHADEAAADKWSAENAIDRDVALAVARYGARVRAADLVEQTIAGELAVLHDPYSVLFRPREYKQFVGFLDARAGAGIGAELDADPQSHQVRIVDVFPGSPAESAGLRRGDLIASIDGRPPEVRGLAAQLRGAAGTTVRIAVVREGEPRPPVAIVRRAVSAPDVLARMLTAGVGYVRIRSFGAHAPQEFDAALKQLRDARALVLDLREDGGGYRDSAIAVASHFVDGTIVSTRERGSPPQVFVAKPMERLRVPLAVLVNGDTASASEIVAGAIQDARAGTLVGEKTFGKGLVQETFPLPGGAAIKLTVASYRTPAGRDIEGTGLQPDLAIGQPAGSQPGEPGRDPQLDRALAALETR